MYSSYFAPDPDRGCPPKDPLKDSDERPIKDLKKPKISADAAIEVYYTEAPLGGDSSPFRKPKAGELKSYLVTPNANHTGVAFRVIQKGKENMEFVFNLIAKDFGMYVLVPHLDYPVTDIKDIDWCNGAMYTYIPYIDRNYWSKSDYICTVTRQDLYDLIDWLQTVYPKKNSTYIFLSVIKEVSRESIFNPIRRSCLCDDFCYDIFRYFQQEKNIAIQYVTVPDYNTASLVVGNSEVTELDMAKKENQTKVVNFYKNVYIIFGDLFRVIAVLKKGNPVEKLSALNKFKADLSKILGPKAKAFIDEATTDLINLGQDIMNILTSVNLDPSNPEAQRILKAWQNFEQVKNLPNFFILVSAIASYLKAMGQQDKIDKFNDDLTTIKGLLPKLMSNFTEIIYYGYDDNDQMGYFLIKGPVSIYLNYLETDLTRDRPVYNIYGKLVTDAYTDKNMNNRLIDNYNCTQGNMSLYFVIGVIAILAIVFLIFWIRARNRKLA